MYSSEQRKLNGLANAKKLLQRDPDYYKKLGKLGGKVKVTKGFGTNTELASRAGIKGGSMKASNVK